MRKAFATAALLAATFSVTAARAQQTAEGFAQPISNSHLWLEVGGDWEHYAGGDARAFPPLSDFPTSGLRPDSGFGYEGKLTYRPKEGEKIFSFAVRYGATATRDRDFGFWFPDGEGQSFQGLAASHREHRLVADFEVGRDVGRGEFDIYSIGSLGLRYADFQTRTRESFSGSGNGVALGDAQVRRGLRAVGPRIAWHGSTPLGGLFDDAGIFLGWDTAAAVLFGHQTVGADVTSAGGATMRMLSRSHGAVVPNIEGRLDLGWHIPGTTATAKLGIRSEAFYNVLDGGLESRHSLRRVDYGPFFSVVWSLR